MRLAVSERIDVLFRIITAPYAINWNARNATVQYMGDPTVLLSSIITKIQMVWAAAIIQFFQKFNKNPWATLLIAHHRRTNRTAYDNDQEGQYGYYCN